MSKMTLLDSIGCTGLCWRLVISQISAEAVIQHEESGRDWQMCQEFNGVKADISGLRTGAG